MAEIGKLVVSLESNTAKFSEDLGRVQTDLDGVAGKAESSGKRMVSSFGSGREGLMLLEESTGVRLPRALTHLIAEIGPVGLAFSTMLPILGVIAAIDVIGKLIEKHNAAAESMRKMGIASEDAAIAGTLKMSDLNDKLVEAQNKADDLAGNHLAALRGQLELLDHASLKDLIKSLDDVTKEADTLFETMFKNAKEWYDVFGQQTSLIGGAKSAWDAYSQGQKQMYADQLAAENKVKAVTNPADKIAAEQELNKVKQTAAKNTADTIDAANANLAAQQFLLKHANDTNFQQIGIAKEHAAAVAVINDKYAIIDANSVSAQQQLITQLNNRKNVVQAIANIEDQQEKNLKTEDGKKDASEAAKAAAQRAAAEKIATVETIRHATAVRALADTFAEMYAIKDKSSTSNDSSELNQATQQRDNAIASANDVLKAKTQIYENEVAMGGQTTAQLKALLDQYLSDVQANAAAIAQANLTQSADVAIAESIHKRDNAISVANDILAAQTKVYDDEVARAGNNKALLKSLLDQHVSDVRANADAVAQATTQADTKTQSSQQRDNAIAAANDILAAKTRAYVSEVALAGQNAEQLKALLNQHLVDVQANTDAITQANTISSDNISRTTDAAIAQAIQKRDNAVLMANDELVAKTKLYNDEVNRAGHTAAQLNDLLNQHLADVRANADAIAQANATEQLKVKQINEKAVEENFKRLETSIAKQNEMADKVAEHTAKVAQENLKYNEATDKLDLAAGQERINSAVAHETMTWKQARDAKVKLIQDERDEQIKAMNDEEATVVKAKNDEVNAAKKAAADQQALGVVKGDPGYIDYLEKQKKLLADIDALNKKVGQDSVIAWKQGQQAIQQQMNALTPFQQKMKQVQSQFNSDFAQMIVSGKNFGQSMKQMGAQLAEELIAYEMVKLEKTIMFDLKDLIHHQAIGTAKKAADAAAAAASATTATATETAKTTAITTGATAQTTAVTAGVTAQTASIIAGATAQTTAIIAGITAQTAAATASILTQKALGASLAGTNMMASYALAPWPIDMGAPAAAAAAMATALAFADGGKVPGTGYGDTVPAMLSPGETVVSAALTEQVTNNTGSTNKGGDVHHNWTYAPQISAIDSTGVEAMLKKHNTIFQKHVASTMRKQNKRYN